MYNFPEGPIRPRSSGYVTKEGKQSSLGDYEKYLNWSVAM
jgi:hypothetical protein